jgi:nucleoside-diphosphate-sugar epimerase
MRILLTGATGFIGRWLVPALIEAGHEVWVIARPTTNIKVRPQLGISVLIDDGIRDLQADLLAHGPFDGIIHLASLFLASHRSDDIVPLLESNLIFPTRILDAAARSGVRWFVNTGTSWQHYEGQEYSPVNLYAATKQAFEALAQFYVEAHGLRFVTLALGDTYGPKDRRPKLLNLWCQISMTGVPLEMSEGLQKMDPVYITDVVEAYKLIVARLGTAVWSDGTMPTFSITSGESLSLRELACLFEKVTCRKLPIRWGTRPMRPREIIVPWEGKCKLQNWMPKISLFEGLTLMWRSFSDSKTHIADWLYEKEESDGT